MIRNAEQRDAALAKALVEMLPQLVRSLVSDVPLVYDIADGDADLREISELRATPGQLSLLRVLIENERCTMQTLAEHMAVAPSTATAMVKRLLAQGYVERSRDEVDWRTVWVAPTERGRQVYTTFNRIQIASLCHRLDYLSAQEREVLIAALPALRHLIDAHL